jgi:hypothetical protein
VGFAACVLNVLALLGPLLSGESVAAALVWIVAPVIIGAYLIGSSSAPVARAPSR